MKTKAELKLLFENGDTPAQADFYEWMDSYWHKEDPEDLIPAERVNLNLSSKADLVGGKVPSNQLPSYIDDVLEFAELTNFPADGETGKLYVALDTSKLYRWSGSVYIDITQPEKDTLDTVSKKGNLSSVPIIIKDDNATLDFNPSGDSNMSFGNMNPLATGSGNLSFGKSALKAITSGNYNTAIGADTLRTLTTGQGNTALGWAMTGNIGGNITGKLNVGLGVSALNNLQGGHRNTAINSCGSNVTTGTDNIFIGYLTGNSIKTGKNNVFLGNGAGATATNGPDYSNKLCIASRTFNNSTGFFDTATTNYTDYKEGLISGDFLVKEVNINGKFSITADKMPNADITYTKTIVAKADGTFGWEDRKTLQINAAKGTTVPTAPVAGDLFYNTTDNRHYGYNGTAWNPLY